MNTRTKILTSTMVVGVLGSLAALGILGSFSATTENTGNEVTAGTVAISNNGAGQAMFSIDGAKPGDSWTRCIKVTYTGSLASDVHTYLGGATGPLAPYVNLKIEEGTATSADPFPQCTTFTATDTLYDGPILSQHTDYDSGLVTYPGGVQGPWNAGSSTVYRVTATLSPSAPDSQQEQSTGIVTASWEAHNE